jgi:hypothetical protein
MPNAQSIQKPSLETATLPDRRRQGRRNNVSPSLIPLLRDAAANGFPDPWADDEPDQLSTARGLIVGLLLSTIIWIPIGFLVWRLI